MQTIFPHHSSLSLQFTMSSTLSSDLLTTEGSTTASTARAKTPSVADLTHSSPDSKSKLQSTSNSTSPSTSRTYDPRALLAPRATSRQPHNPQVSTGSPYMMTLQSGSSSPSRGAMDIDTIPHKRRPSGEPSGGGSRLEDLYSVQERTAQPRKKVKNDAEEAEHSKFAQPSFTRRSNGIVGDYMKPEAGKVVPLTVDLTNGRLIFTFLPRTLLIA